ncbi:MAG: hypothetical protein IPP19_16480 [Verrucomicrobia bacterium]|nr:hypothetical protein [Verrucomicrobiota bacterium]
MSVQLFLKPTASSSEPLLENLNTHTIASLYETYPPAEAHRPTIKTTIRQNTELAQYRGNQFTHSTASACDGASSIEAMRTEIAAWQKHRNNRGAPSTWHFTTQDAHKTLRLYPKL